MPSRHGPAAMVEAPSAFTAVLEERHGEVGLAWAAALPGTVAEICRRWGLVVEGAPMIGHLALVVPVLRGGEPCALRLAALDGSAVDETPTFEPRLETETPVPSVPETPTFRETATSLPSTGLGQGAGQAQQPASTVPLLIASLLVMVAVVGTLTRRRSTR